MRGCEKRMEREMEIATFSAWQVARMTYYGDKRLKPLGDWLKELKPSQPKRRQTPEEMIAALRAIKATLH